MNGQLVDSVDQALEERMKDAVEAWAAAGTLDRLRAARLAQIVRRRARRERAALFGKRFAIGVTAAVASVALVLVLSPAARTWAAEKARSVPIIGRFIQGKVEVEKGWGWAEEHHMFQEVVASHTDKGLTLRVHRVLADPTATFVFYTVEGADGKAAGVATESGTGTGATVQGPVRIDNDASRFNGRRFIGSWTSEEEVLDGVLVGYAEFGGLTGSPTGTLKLAVRYIGGIVGNWDVSFPVTQTALGSLTRTIPVGESVPVPGGTFTVAELTLSPVQTTVKAHFESGPSGEHREPLTVGLGSSAANGLTWLRSRSSEAKGSAGSMDYVYQFDRLDQVPSSLTLVVNGPVYVADEVRIPLTAASNQGQSGDPARAGAPAPKVQGLTVTADGTVTATMVTPASKQFWGAAAPEDWKLMDDAGDTHTGTIIDSHLVELGKEAGAKNLELHTTVRWTILPGRRAVALVSPGYWALKNALGQLEIAIPSGQR